MRIPPFLLAASLLACHGVAAETVAPIPFELVGAHVFVEVELAGETLSFAFDTAAQGMALHRGTAQRLGIEPSGWSTAGGAAGTMRVGWRRGLTLRLGELHLEDLTAFIAPLDHLAEAAGRPIDGILGDDLLRGRLVLLDYDRQVIEILERPSLRTEEWGAACALEAAASPEVVARVCLLDGETIEGRFLVDTGAGAFLKLTSELVGEHALEGRVGRGYLQTGLSFTEHKTRDRVGRVASVSFCGHEFPPTERGGRAEGLPTLLSGARGGTMGGGRAGLIGGSLLSRFDLLLDLDRRRLYLRPNRRQSEPIRTDASGLQLVRRADGRTLVFDVIPESPAAEAGVRPGDELRALNGEDVASLDLYELRRRLREPDRLFRLALARAGVPKAVDLRSRRLLAD